MAMTGPAAEYRVSELATAAGVGVRTVRYYQERGLLPPPRGGGRPGRETRPPRAGRGPGAGGGGRGAPRAPPGAPGSGGGGCRGAARRPPRGGGSR
ncbi:MerR family transcriptional regulator, partial [Nocardia wallacei]|uniref:MerR family transcriptional regulator n=1 Tax=Nocardia wallacei TaxID=480035 RepID=UPI003CC80600